MTEPSKLFISYAREDSESARRLFFVLRKQPGVLPWLDSESLLPGARWTDEILNQIESCDFILVLLSRKSVNKAGFVQREIREAIERLQMFPPGRRVLIPIRLEPCEPSHRELRKLHYLDMFPSWDNAITNLFRSIGTRRYTHSFVALGSTQRDACRLAPLGSSYKVPPSQIIPVSLADLPEFSVELVPTPGLWEAGVPRNVFHGLWTRAVIRKSPLYRKSDWLDLSEIVFADKRSKRDKEKLIRIIKRQWALAREFPGYDESGWLKLHTLVQTHFK